MNQQTRYDVITIGDFCVDLILSGADVVPEFGQVEKVVEDYSLEIGGSTCIFAAQAAKLGLVTAIFGAVGEDFFGNWLKDKISREGVDVTWVQSRPDLKTGVGVALDKGSDRAILTYLGSIDAVCERDIPDEFLKASRHLHIGSFYLMRQLQPGIPHLIERAKGFGLTVSLDTNWDPDNQWGGGLREILSHIDVLFPNENELLAISGTSNPGEALRELGKQVPTVAVKGGVKGGWLWRSDRGIECRIRPVHEVDGIGAGDSFDAGFINGLLRGWSDKATLKAACACGAANVRSRGGVAGQIDAEGLRSFMMDPELDLCIVSFKESL